MIISVLLAFLACEKPNDWNTALESKKCRSNPTCAPSKKGLLREECHLLRSRKTPPKPIEIASLTHFCDALLLAEDATTVACGLPACVDLAQVDPQAALNRLSEISVGDSKKKSQRQSLILGLLRSEERFTLAIQASLEADRTSWWGEAVAETDCGQASIANRLNQACSEPMIKAANVALTSGKDTEKPLFKVLTAFNLALALNPKLDAEMAKTAVSETEHITQKQAAAQALRVHFERQKTIEEPVKRILAEACKTPSRTLIGLCP